MPPIISSHYVPLKGFALGCGFYGLCQSFIWTTITIFFVLSRHARPNAHKLTNLFGNLDQSIFQVFDFAMYLLSGLSFAWFLASLNLVIRVTLNEVPYPKTNQTKYAYISWALVVLANSFVDLILTLALLWESLLLPVEGPEGITSRVPYKNYFFDQPSSSFEPNSLKLLISCRFIILWFVNVVLATVIFVAPFAPIVGKKRNRTKACQYKSDDFIYASQSELCTPRVCSMGSMQILPFYRPTVSTKHGVKKLSKIFLEE